MLCSYQVTSAMFFISVLRTDSFSWEPQITVLSVVFFFNFSALPEKHKLLQWMTD